MTTHYNKPSEKEKRRKLRKEQTSSEKLVWTYLRNRKFLVHKFRRQYSVDSYVIDFYCPALKLAVEIDGDIHNSGEQKVYDLNRQRHIEKYGIMFLRITVDELQGNVELAFKKIAYEIERLERGKD